MPMKAIDTRTKAKALDLGIDLSFGIVKNE
jgi:hypothetical protein